ncbi:hypothetical protein NE865_15454 [Phthorimaea operculella]|nr:hypothetical protein NE865_15454 [Phthorimaea operculella]
MSKKETKTVLRKARSAAMKTVRAHKNNLLHILMHSNANPIRNKDMMVGIQCHYCPVTLQTSRELKIHFVTEHRDEKFIQSRMKEFVKIVWKLDITDLQCTVCAFGVKNITELLTHFKNRHDMNVEPDVEDIYLPFRFDTPELRCAICDVEFAVFRHLREHMNQHFRNFICDVCDTGYVTRELLSRHKLRHKVSPTPCAFCDKEFSSKQRANQHMKTVHFNSKRYKCPDCDERFMEFNMKLRHMHKAHGKSMELSCQICDRMFVAPRALRMHMRQYHLGERRYLCAACGKGFNTLKQMREHKSAEMCTQDSCVCEVCLAVFVDESDLREHVKTHGDLQCLFCTKIFVDHSVLKAHVQRIHSDLIE